ncbi:MAG TPA: hypothetical protein VKU79_01575, partial [Thermoplasmataceae archaeon]|nr:hypothetical protein [Thermoplasmataceae archaeon]
STRVKQIQADHKLLLKLSENLDRWIEKGDQSLIRERAPLYIRLLKDHNANEDKFVFRWWNPSDHSHENDVIREASSVIENFGVDRYLAITGASKELFEKMFKK